MQVLRKRLSSSMKLLVVVTTCSVRGTFGGAGKERQKLKSNLIFLC